MIESLGPDANHNGSNLGVAVVYIGGEKTFHTRTLLRFIVAALAADTINSASLWLYQTTTYDSNGVGATVARCGETWGESAATWNDRATGTAWAVAGGSPDTGTPPEVAFSAGLGATGWKEITGLGAHVVDGIDNRANAVRLNLMLDDEDPGSSEGALYHDKENVGGTLHPQLVVNYTLASPAGIPFERPSRQQRALLRR